MHLVDEQDAVRVRSTDDLLAYFETASKPASHWRVGTEHELVGVRVGNGDPGEPPTYDGPHGIGALFEWFAARGGSPVLEQSETGGEVEGGHMIALSRGDAQLTIEPGGQFELAARPVADDRDFAADLSAYVPELGAASRELGLAWLATGLRPFGRRDDVPWMPKQRYAVMRDYMPTVGTRGLDMMLRTATVQANLDFADEADAAAKLRCLYSVTSLLTALWACSPIVEDQISDYQSYRAWIWRDTDNARAGLLPFVFERSDVFRAYTEWALDVPMYFLYRGGYHRVPADFTFRRFMRDGLGDQHALRADWALHLSTLFPDGRLKKFIEVRGCDCGSMEMIAALGPMMRGLLYDPAARAAATALTAGLSFADRQRLADDVPRLGFAARAGKRSVGDLAAELVAIARDGLSRVAPAALPLLAPVEDIAATRRTQADAMVELWETHAGDRAALVRALAHPGLAGPA
ncbi:MAG TPA: glutamate-cysteine ligase family protein [Kofleriaceae bacterium]|nr:glutamate-cysteine ligase family protein [Kofleriaceae bacterium]